MVDVGEIGPWAWTLPDGRSFDLHSAQTVTIDITRGGTTNRAESHLVDVDGEYRWFTICG